MDAAEIRNIIERRLAERAKKVVNRNAFQALFGAFADPVGALGKVFLGRKDALDAERSRIQEELILDLLCRIDDAISETDARAKAAGVKWTEVTGCIEAVAEGGDAVTGVHVTSDAGPVEFKPGTAIRASGIGTKNVTGLKIGGER